LVAREFHASGKEARRRARLRRQKQISAAIQRLVRRRLVHYEERGRETFLVITREGRSEMKKFVFEELALSRAAKWDGKWRVVLFDIPERYKRGREALRYKLRALGFFPLQKSVFVFPYECHDEIDFVARFCSVERCVEYFTCDGLSQGEVSARRHFRLLDATV
jgi:DNA-binding transcriptional regulator PaaX